MWDPLSDKKKEEEEEGRGKKRRKRRDTNESSCVGAETGVMQPQAKEPRSASSLQNLQRSLESHKGPALVTPGLQTPGLWNSKNAFLLL
jgi:hypothetical protein